MTGVVLLWKSIRLMFCLFLTLQQKGIMDHLPKDPAILVSSVNMLLRDGEYDSLEQLCNAFGRDAGELKAYLHGYGYVYSEKQRQMRPEGYDR